MRPIQKTDGLYRKRRLTAVTRVPLLIWLPAVLILASVITILSLKIQSVNDSAIADQPVVRKASWRIAAVGNMACSTDALNYNDGEGIVGACQMKSVGDALARESLDAVLLLGDMQYPAGQFEQSERSFIPYYRDITAPVYSVAGDADYASGTLDGYKKSFDQYMPNVTYQKEGKTYYDFNLGPWKVYAFDSNCQYVGGCGYGTPQHNWLTSKVTESTAICSIAFWHHSLFSSGTRKSGTPEPELQPFWSTLITGQTDIVLSAQDNHYERFAPKLADGTLSDEGIRQFISGTGGYSVRPATAPAPSGQQKVIDDQFGYLYLELYQGRYEWSYKNIYGEVLDTGMDTCR